jgi:hypothetical protein
MEPTRTIGAHPRPRRLHKSRSDHHSHRARGHRARELHIRASTASPHFQACWPYWRPDHAEGSPHRHCRWAAACSTRAGIAPSSAVITVSVRTAWFRAATERASSLSDEVKGTLRGWSAPSTATRPIAAHRASHTATQAIPHRIGDRMLIISSRIRGAGRTRSQFGYDFPLKPGVFRPSLSPGPGFVRGALQQQA